MTVKANVMAYAVLPYSDQVGFTMLIGAMITTTKDTISAAI